VQQTIFMLLGKCGGGLVIMQHHCGLRPPQPHSAQLCIMIPADAMRVYFLTPRFYAASYPYFGVRSKMVRRCRACHLCIMQST